jgi:hypothetical protein
VNTKNLLATITIAASVVLPGLAYSDTAKFPIFKETYKDKTFTGEVWHYANCAEGDGFYEWNKRRWRDARSNDPVCPNDLPGDNHYDDPPKAQHSMMEQECIDYNQGDKLALCLAEIKEHYKEVDRRNKEMDQQNSKCGENKKTC